MHLSKNLSLLFTLVLSVDAAVLPTDSCTNEGEIWKVNDCKECRCWDEKIWCDVITCTVFDDVGCNSYRKVPGTCCNYTCLDDTTEEDADLDIDSDIIVE